MDRIAYEIPNTDGDEPDYVFDREVAADLAPTGQAAKAMVVDVEKVAVAAWRKLDGLDRLFFGSFDTDETIAYCVVTKPGGVDGRDHTAKGGYIRAAFHDRKEAEKRVDGWSRIEARAVVPVEVGIHDEDKVTRLEVACIGEMLGDLRVRSGLPRSVRVPEVEPEASSFTPR